MTIQTLSTANALAERIKFFESKLFEAAAAVEKFDFNQPGIDDCEIIEILKEFSEEAIGTHEYAKILLTFMGTEIKRMKDELEAL